MRLSSLIFGVIVLAFGIVLVSTNGVVAGVNLPGLIGYPSCSKGTPANASSPQCFGFAGFGVGTIVCLFGLGMVANGLRASSSPSGFGRGGKGIPPEIAAALAQSNPNLSATSGPSPIPGGRFCPECGRQNAADAKFCQGCGRTMPPAQPSPASPPTASGSPPQS